MVLLLSQMVFAQPACQDLNILVEQSMSSLFIGDVESSQNDIKLIEERFVCTIPPNIDTLLEDIGNYLLLKAYMAHMEGVNSQRDRWLQQVKNLQHWNPNFGLEIEKELETMQIQQPFTLDISPKRLPEDVQLWINGTQEELPVQIYPGMHWMWVVKNNQSTWVTVDFLSPTDSIVLPIDSTTGSSSSSILAGGVFLGVSAMTTHILASMHHREIYNASNIEDLNHSFQRSKVFGISSVVLMSSAALLTVKWFKESRGKENES